MLGNRFGNVGEVGMEIAMHICSARDDGNGKAPCNHSISGSSVLIGGGTGGGSASLIVA